jgi:N-acetylglucosaminyldiphosphoundecaprenol N-acetyl-beta-D-mannosaminyltransferase
MDALPSMRVLGTRVHLVDNDKVLALLEEWIARREGGCRFVVVTGFHGLWVAHQDPDFRRIVASADLFSPDGIAPVWIAKLKGRPLAARATGPDLMESFFRRANRAGYRSFFLGDTEDTLRALRSALEYRFPGHVVAGTLSPPFRELTPEEDEQIVRAINESRPDVVWVGLGLPKQERWIHEHRSRLNAAVAVGVGAAFKFSAGKINRPPEWVGRNGLEWLWRLAQEPGKLWRRDLVDGPRFVWHVLLEVTGLRRYGGDKSGRPT